MHGSFTALKDSRCLDSLGPNKRSIQPKFVLKPPRHGPACSCIYACIDMYIYGYVHACMCRVEHTGCRNLYTHRLYPHACMHVHVCYRQIRACSYGGHMLIKLGYNFGSTTPEMSFEISVPV